MRSPSVLDIDLLLKPISKSLPSGESIRNSQPDLYYKIKDARTSARNIERQYPEDTSKAKNFWDTIFEDTVGVLSTYSKDLEISAWLIEALVRKYELVGFRDGFTVVNGFLSNFWDTLYPLPDPQSPGDRFFAFAGLNGEDQRGALITPLYGIHITQGKSVGPFALWNYTEAVELEKISDPQKRINKIAAGAASLADLQTAVKETQKEFFLAFKDDLQDAVKEYETFVHYVDDKCGKDAPPTSWIRSTLEVMEEAFNFLTKDLFVTDSQQADQTSSSSSSGATSQQPFEGGSLVSRDVAFKNLLEIARFFKRTEPQSPLPYILERAVRWGQLSLPDLLSELIDDEGAKNKLFKLTGMGNNT